VMKSIPLSVMVAERSPAPNPSFPFNNCRTGVMGVLNATPDSFYPGSRALQTKTALHLAKVMIQDGADALDIGGESTRPGAEAVSAELELERVLPVIDAIRCHWPKIPLSIDTQKAEVVRQAIARGASLINDISALRNDPAMVEVVAASGCPVILMHMQGTPQTMQNRPQYKNVIDHVMRFFEERLTFVTRHNISEDRVILDPGIGFGKTLAHNMTLLKHLSDFLSLKRPLLVGVSRKSFIGRWLGHDQAPLPPEERLEGSLAAALWAVQQGARILRVHDVGPTRRALHLWEGIQTT
jgi:dihydropteroate synthase